MPSIVDAAGQPIKKRELSQPQTARVAALQHDFAEHPSRGLTPAKLANILERAERGDLLAQLDLFEDIEEKDGHCFASLSIRRRALLGLDWQIVPPRNATAAEERAAETVADIVAELPMADVMLDMADAIGKSFACLEIDWAQEAGQWLPEDIALRPQRWFTLPQDQPFSTELRLRDNSADGEALQPFGWIVHRHAARPGHFARSALGRVLAWPFLFKNYSVRDLAEFLEIYGLPLRLGTYPPGASDREKATLMRAVASIGHAAAGIIPEGMAIEFEEAAKGASDPYVAMMDWCERTQSKVILGATLTSQADRGSNTNALGNVHNELRRDLLISDARQIATTLTRDLIYPLAALNIGGIANIRRAPRFEFDTREPEDLKLYADALPKLARTMEIPARWAHDKLQIPLREDNEPILGTRDSGLGTRARAATRAQLPPHAAALAGVTGEDATPTNQTDRLGSAAQPAIDGWIERVRELLNEVDDLPELAERLLELYPELTPDDLADVMGEAFTAASLAGRYDLLDEIGRG